MRGAIFDMDGTLLDSMQVWIHVGEQAFVNRESSRKKSPRCAFSHEHAGRSSGMKEKHSLV